MVQTLSEVIEARLKAEQDRLEKEREPLERIVETGLASEERGIGSALKIVRAPRYLERELEAFIAEHLARDPVYTYVAVPPERSRCGACDRDHACIVAFQPERMDDTVAVLTRVCFMLAASAACAFSGTALLSLNTWLFEYARVTTNFVMVGAVIASVTLTAGACDCYWHVKVAKAAREKAREGKKGVAM